VSSKESIGLKREHSKESQKDKEVRPNRFLVNNVSRNESRDKSCEHSREIRGSREMLPE